MHGAVVKTLDDLPSPLLLRLFGAKKSTPDVVKAGLGKSLVDIVEEDNPVKAPTAEGAASGYDDDVVGPHPMRREVMEYVRQVFLGLYNPEGLCIFKYLTLPSVLASFPRLAPYQVRCCCGRGCHALHCCSGAKRLRRSAPSRAAPHVHAPLRSARCSPSHPRPRPSSGPSQQQAA